MTPLLADAATGMTEVLLGMGLPGVVILALALTVAIVVRAHVKKIEEDRKELRQDVDALKVKLEAAQRDLLAERKAWADAMLDEREKRIQGVRTAMDQASDLGSKYAGATEKAFDVVDRIVNGGGD